VPLIVAFGAFVNSAGHNSGLSRDADAMIARQLLYMHMASSTTPACPHKRTRLIAKDSDAQYTECLDCGEILEAGETEKKKDSAGYDESLSDA
jgi:hypothetical protein